MMGRRAFGQTQLFYEFDLDSMVLKDHLLRRIDQNLDLSDLRTHLEPFYSHTGRPSVDPELLIRMLIVGYAFGIRSERKLCEEVRLNLAYRWFCRLGIEDPIPDHSTFSKNRSGRFRESGALRHLFETTLECCISKGMVGGEGFAVDASIIPADASRQRGLTPEKIAEGKQEVGVAVLQYLEALDAESKPSKIVSLTDPTARWTAAKGAALYAYSANYLVDLRSGVIVDTETTQALKTDEVDASRTMLDRTRARFGLHPKRLAADTAYGTGPMLHWLKEKRDIEPHVPVWDKTKAAPGRIPIADFKWDEAANQYICPQGKVLKTRGTVGRDNTKNYLAKVADCRSCPLKQSCTPKKKSRTIRRSIYENARQHARSLVSTAAYAQSKNDRKKVEMSFAQLKRTLGITRLRLRGLANAADELLLAAIALNLRKLARTTALADQ